MNCAETDDYEYRSLASKFYNSTALTFEEYPGLITQKSCCLQPSPFFLVGADGQIIVLPRLYVTPCLPEKRKLDSERGASSFDWDRGVEAAPAKVQKRRATVGWWSVLWVRPVSKRPTMQTRIQR